MKIPKGRVQGDVRKARGGPWAGEFVFLPSNSTMVFTIGAFHGYYDGFGNWVEVPRG